jgi:predicted Zn finger-like uncharacterized protein
MNVECPACKARGKINGEKLPKEGKTLICPRCGERFMVVPERSAVEIIQQREQMHCPKCGCEQPLAETCAICGVDIKKHIRMAELQRDLARLEFTRLRSESRQVDRWYRDLFDSRFAGLIARVLFLLVGLAILMTCSMRGVGRNTQANKFNHDAENREAIRKAAEGTSRLPVLPNQKFKERLRPFLDVADEQVALCFDLCYKKHPELNQRDGRERDRASGSLELLSRIERGRTEARALFERIPTPEQPYWDCYGQAKQVNNLYDDIYELAAESRVQYNDLGERLAGFREDYRKAREKLDACKESIK